MDLVPRRQQTLASYMIDARLTGDFSKMFNCRVYLTSIQKLIRSIRDFFFPVCYSVLVTVILIYAPSDQEICDRCKVLKLCNLSWETRERSMYCIDPKNPVVRKLGSITAGIILYRDYLYLVPHKVTGHHH
jgi:hypothetical protein